MIFQSSVVTIVGYMQGLVKHMKIRCACMKFLSLWHSAQVIEILYPKIKEQHKRYPGIRGGHVKTRERQKKKKTRTLICATL